MLCVRETKQEKFTLILFDVQVLHVNLNFIIDNLVVDFKRIVNLHISTLLHTKGQRTLHKYTHYTRAAENKTKSEC